MERITNEFLQVFQLEELKMEICSVLDHLIDKSSQSNNLTFDKMTLKLIKHIVVYNFRASGNNFSTSPYCGKLMAEILRKNFSPLMQIRT